MPQQPEADGHRLAQLPHGHELVPAGGEPQPAQQPFNVATLSNVTTWSNWSGHALLLGYLEGNPIYAACNFNLAREWSGNYCYAANQTATGTIIQTFLCPSDPNAGQESSGAAYGSNNSFMGSIGTTSIGYPEATPNYANAQISTGIFAYQKCYGVADVLDGTSNTIAYSEEIADDNNSAFSRKPGKGTGGAGNLKAVYLTDVNTAGMAAVLNDFALCTAKYNSDGGGKEGGGYRWSCGAMGYTMFNTIVPPNGGGQYKWGACRNNCCPQSRHADYVGATSFHPGGVNVAFADGSVRFIKNSIAMNIWWRSEPGPTARPYRRTPTDPDRPRPPVATRHDLPRRGDRTDVVTAAMMAADRLGRESSLRSRGGQDLSRRLTPDSTGLMPDGGGVDLADGRDDVVDVAAGELRVERDTREPPVDGDRPGAAVGSVADRPAAPDW